MELDLSLGSVTAFALAAAHALRVELAFVALFGLLWLAGRSVGLRLDTRAKGAVLRKGAPLSGSGGSPPVHRANPATLSSNASTSAHLRSTAAASTALRSTAPGTILDDLSACTRCTRGGSWTADGVAAISDAGINDASRLRDPAWLVPNVVQLCRSQVQKALEVYRSALRAGLELRQVPVDDCRQLFLALVTSTIRVGQADEAIRLLRDLQQQGHGIGCALLTSAIKLCTSKQMFSECLATYDLVAEDPSMVIEDKTVWSCLLFCAVESRSHQRCILFFARLKASGIPSHKDYGNMVRYASSQGDWQLSLSLVEEMRVGFVEIDSVVYNTALATCVNADQVDQARGLLAEMEAREGGAADVITYNTLAKGYAKAGRLAQCFELYELMRERGIIPSQVTYGILLDGCINENQVERAAEVFSMMSRQGCAMNTVLYTTLIKGFARAGQVDQAMKVYEQMRTERSVPPDLITFSILIKANCDAGRLEASLGLLESMLGLGLRPDEVVFNNLLGGCVKEGNAELAKRLYQDMAESGIRPSNATFSILIRLYAQCRLLDEAVDMLRVEPAARGVDPEPRLFAQLAQCCLRERQGRRALEVYRMLTERAAPTVAVHSSILGMCVKLNMLETGADILSLAATSGGRVDVRDAAQLLEAAIKKRKPAVAEAISNAMKRLGLSSGA